jgi:hypothetical protein
VINRVSHIESRWDIVEFLEYTLLWMRAHYSFVICINPVENVRYVSDGKRLVEVSSLSFIIVICSPPTATCPEVA